MMLGTTLERTGQVGNGLQVLRRIAARPSGLVGLILLAAHLALALAGGLIAPIDPSIQDSDAILTGASWAHWLGTDDLGRDILSRTILGGRPALIVTVLGTALAVAIGGTLGIFLGYVGGRIDAVAMRFVDAFLAIPWLLILLVVVAILGNSSLVMIVTLGCLYSVAIIRVMRGATLDVVAQDYITAAHIRAERLPTILSREILPNVLDVALVEGAMRWSWMILTFSGLSFLGFGVAPPTPDWGLMVADSRNYLQITLWPVLPPMIALSSLTLGLNLTADALAKALGVDRSQR